MTVQMPGGQADLVGLVDLVDTEGLGDQEDQEGLEDQEAHPFLQLGDVPGSAAVTGLGPAV